jgi:N-acetylmuramic acid 6-phosphate etherase
LSEPIAVQAESTTQTDKRDTNKRLKGVMAQTESEARIVLAVDGGGSKTAAILARSDGAVLGRGTSGASNHQSVGIRNAEHELTLAIDRAFADAGMTRTPVAAACLGLSGVDRPEDLELTQSWLDRTLPGTNAMIANDAHLVLAAGTPEGWGIALICGTGTICFGCDPAGKRARSDGWGHLLGDDGSGYFLGRAALRAVMRAYDRRGPNTALTDAVLTHWSLSEPERLLYRVYHEGVTTTEIAALARLVSAAAEEGDGVALAIVRDAGCELANTVRSVAQVLDQDSPVPTALAGGAITKGVLIRQAFLEEVQALGLKLGPIECVDQPVVGALRLALRMLGE